MSQLSVTSFEHDKLGLQPFAERLEKFLMVERDFVEGSLVVSLGAPFGFGKTTFLRMWKANLEKRRADSPLTPRPILLNAWESDYCGDPLLAIVTGLIRALEPKKGEADGAPANKLREAAKDVAWFAVGLANSFVSNATGVDPNAASEFAQTKKDARKPEKPDFVALYEGRVEALDHLKQTLREVFNDGKAPAIVLVDELDRCRPDYAISYLETIKHVFDIPGLIFVLAVDYDHLANSARALFGPKLKFEEYYRKFVQRVIDMPAPDKNAQLDLSRAYAQEFLAKQGKRQSLMSIHRHVLENITELVGAYRLTPRQIQEVFRIIGHTLARESKHNGEGDLLTSIGMGVMLMATLKVGKPELFQSIARHEHSSHKALASSLLELLGEKKGIHWYAVYYTGALGDDVRGARELFPLHPAETKEQIQSFQEYLNQVSLGWGDFHEQRIQQICNHIETVGKY